MNRLSILNDHFSMNKVSAAEKWVRTTIDRDTHVALVEMNPPTKLIALGTRQMTSLSDELDELEKNDDVSVVVLTGKGRSFAVGADIQELLSKKQRDWLFSDR